MPAPTVELLRGVPLFSGLDDALLSRLSGEFFEKTFAPGETIATEGGSGRTFVLIDSGEVSVWVHDREVRRLGPGTAFGEMALIDKAARSATVRAETETHCYLMPVWSFRPLVEERPEMTWSLLESLAQRIRDVEARDG
ncbi:MAG TPA: cyclic nucleotide-binding domain-containing protein [Gaiellaceae bacterium]|nr:cyclic nucleotide-binding domain-containing protein [Gaiellaceae bacterium]